MARRVGVSAPPASSVTVTAGLLSGPGDAGHVTEPGQDGVRELAGRRDAGDLGQLLFPGRVTDAGQARAGSSIAERP
jgi:hypothetical protein